MEQIMTYFQNNMDTFLSCLAEHIRLSLISLFAAMAIGIPAGYAATTGKFKEKSIMAFFQVLRVIPSLALLALLIPIMGTGVKPAVTALTVLAIPPILMNSAEGFKNVDRFFLEVSDGMGMTKKQRFWKVHLPLALPMILAGIRTAIIEIIASATIAAKIGAGGLGSIIVTGLGLNRSDFLIVGGVSVAILSITAVLILNGLDKLFLRYRSVGR